MSAALSYRAHAPLIDSLLKEVGLAGGSLQGLVPGLAAAASHTDDAQVLPLKHASYAGTSSKVEPGSNTSN